MSLKVLWRPIPQGNELKKFLASDFLEGNRSSNSRIICATKANTPIRYVERFVDAFPIGYIFAAVKRVAKRSHIFLFPIKQVVSKYEVPSLFDPFGLYRMDHHGTRTPELPPGIQLRIQQQQKLGERQTRHHESLPQLAGRKSRPKAKRHH